jgi:hypothetical protein
MGLAPNPGFPERVGNTYETKVGVNSPRRGPLRFEEGIATDTDVPNDFTEGVMQGYRTPPGHPNHNANVYEKYPEETMRQRAHMGSAAWVEAPTFLGEFARGAGVGSRIEYEQVDRSGGRYERLNPANVPD